MKFRHKPTVVTAIQLTGTMEITTEGVTQIGNAGDYLVERTPGDNYVVKKEIFESLYVSVPSRAKSA